MPALFTSTSICPSSSASAVSHMLRGAAGSARSPATSSSFPLVEWPTTRCPLDFKCAYAAAPMPRLAPVMRMFMAPGYPAAGGGGRTLGGHSVHERLRTGLEIGDLVGEPAKTLLDLVDVLGDIFSVAPDRRNGRAHRVGRERGFIDGGSDHGHRLRLKLHGFTDTVG